MVESIDKYNQAPAPNPEQIKKSLESSEKLIVAREEREIFQGLEEELTGKG